MLRGDGRVEAGGVEARLAGRHDDLDEGVCGELHHEDGAQRANLEREVPDLVRVARRARVLGQAGLERLPHVAEALIAVDGRVAPALLRGPLGDDEERGALVQQDLLRLDGGAEAPELLLDDSEVGDQVVDDGGPGFVERLVPDGSGKWLDLEALRGMASDGGHVLEGFGRLGLSKTHALVEDLLALGAHDEIHLVDENEDLGGGRVLRQGGHDGHISSEVAIDVTRLDVKDVDEDADIAENVDALLVNVVFHKCLLTATIPQIKRQVAQKLHMRQIDIDGRTAINLTCQRRFSRSTHAKIVKVKNYSLHLRRLSKGTSSS